MCGIFGAVGEAELKVDAALDALAHRGPDARGVWRDRQAALGHTRLAVIDLTPTGAQPMVAPDGSTVVVFNGEIYNHHELRAELGGLGHCFRSTSDTEVIVEGYRAWGPAVIERLDGMFALGLWDAPRRRLLLARDRAGKKPLFYCASDGAFRFASEVKALLAAGVPAEVEASSLPHLLSFGYTPAPQTMFRGIHQLPPASRLTLEWNGAPSVRQYWQAPFLEPPIACDEREAIAEVRRLTEAAIVRRLEADVPLGAFLSGGVDSTIVVGVMSRHLRSPVKTFSIGFPDDADYDEASIARTTAAALGAEHTEFQLDPIEPDLIGRLVWHHDGPFGDSSAIPTSIVAGLTRRHVTVALTGDGGDELFCGYLRFLAAEAIERLPASLRRMGAGLGARLPDTGRERALWTRGRRFLQAAGLSLPDRLVSLSPYFGAALPELLPGEAGPLDLDAPAAHVGALVGDAGSASTLARILHHNFECYLPGDLLVKADRCSMMHSLETRSPFLDRALIEFVARLPDRFKRRGLTTKWILRKAFADLLPPAIARGKKTGFGVPLGSWFRGRLRPYLEDHLRPGARLYDYVDERYVRRLLGEHLAGRAYHGHRLWLLLTLEVWLRSLSTAAMARAA